MLYWGVPVKLELDKKGFWARYRKSQITPEVESVLDNIINASNVGFVLDELIGNGALRVE